MLAHLLDLLGLDMPVPESPECHAMASEGIFLGCRRVAQPRPDEATLRFDRKKTLSKANEWTMPADEGTPWEHFRWQQATAAAKHTLAMRAAVEAVNEQKNGMLLRGGVPATMRAAAVVAAGNGNVPDCPQDWENWTMPNDEKRPWKEVEWQVVDQLATSRQQRPQQSRQGFNPKDFGWGIDTDQDKPWEDEGNVRQAVLLEHAGKQRGGGYGRSQQPVWLLENPEVTPSTCMICADDNVSYMGSFMCNQHRYCMDCVGQWIRGSLQSGKVARCPADGCSAEASPELCQTVLTTEEFDSYVLLQLRGAERLKTCPVCSSMLVVEPHNNGGPADHRCPSCTHRFCGVCGLESHPKLSCVEARSMLRRREPPPQCTQTMRDITKVLGLKQCPHCKMSCEKSDKAACDHMTCVSCCHEFCWVCLADRSVIKAHGNHYHLIGCNHYRPYHGPPEMERTCKRCQQRRRACTPPGKDRRGAVRLVGRG